MPILDVETIMQPGEEIRPTLAKEIADGAGLIFGSKPAGTWVRIRPMPAQQYAEGPGDAPIIYPVFVDVLKAALPERDSMQAEAARLTVLIADLCGRSPQNVHVIYQPEGRGRVAFGGRLQQ